MEIKNPFPGIRPFRQSDAEHFFGRGHLTEELFNKLENKRFVSVVGTSGCGKSSLINAGLLPLLAGKNWDVIVTRPQQDPINNLAQELKKINFSDGEASRDGDSGTSGPELQRIWESMIPITLNLTSQGVVETYQQSHSSKKLLIIVDQFEELFQYKSRGSAERENAIKFVNLLLEATSQKEFPIHIIIVMRADFLGHCAQFKGFPEIINDGQFLIPKLSRAQYRDAITGPLERHSINIASNVVSQLLNEIEDDPDQLPILQHALMLTFEEWKNGGDINVTIDINHFQNSGGMLHGIDAHCNRILEELINEGLSQQVRIVFQRLTEINQEGIEIRAPATVQELMILTESNLSDITKILDAFRKDGRNFLSPSVSKPIVEEQIIDLSHECIMRKWTRLQRWIKEEENDKRDLLRLLEHHRNFIEGERQHLKGLTLSNYLNWPPYKGHTKPSVIQWASRYTKDFSFGIVFIRLSKEASEKAERRKRLIRRAWAIGVPAIILLATTFYYLQRLNTQHQIISDSRVTIDSVQNALINTITERDTLQRIIERTKDALQTQKIYEDNGILRAQQKVMSESLALALNRLAALQIRTDSLHKLLVARNLEVKQLRSTISLSNNRLLQRLDSTVQAGNQKQLAYDRQMNQSERLKIALQDSIKDYKRNSATERELKNYFAAQFAEAIKTNTLLLDQLEKSISADASNQPVDRELSNYIKKYVQDNRKKMNSILGSIPATHTVFLYSIYEGSGKKFEEFSALLNANGYDGKIETATVSKNYFSKTGITILANDEKTYDLFKTAVMATKADKVIILNKLTETVNIKKPNQNASVIILHY